MKTISLLYIILFTHCASIEQTSRIKEVLINSPSLEMNLLGDPAERYVSIYLPPSYNSNKNRRYPVVYVLHGNRIYAKSRTIMTLFDEPILELMDSLISNGNIKEMIVVQPDGRNFYGGCQYANSSVSGNWADFIVKDLVDYIDKNYRTLSNVESRGLLGSSMGGRGALDIALKFPGVYGVVYAMFPGQMGFLKFPDDDSYSEIWRELILSNNSNPTKGYLRRALGFSVAFSPNPNSPPYFADFPMTLEGDSMKINEEVRQRWARFDPIELAEKNANPFLKLNKLYFDCGSSDGGIEAVRLFSSILTNQNIPHIFDEYEGGHGDPGAKRFKSKVLPVFSEHLVFD